MSIQKILVPIDFSDHSMHGILYAITIAKEAKASLLLLHIIEPVEDNIHQPFPLHDRYIQEVTALRQRQLEATKQSTAQLMDELETKAEIIQGNVVDCLLDYAKQQKINLIVMATRGAKGLRKMFVGSVAANVIAKSTIPVITVPKHYEIIKPHSVLFATNHFEHEADLLNKVLDIPHIFKSVVNIVVYVKEKEKRSAYIQKLLNYLEFLRAQYTSLTFHGECIDGAHFEEALESYVKNNHPNLIILIPYSKKKLDKFLKDSHTREMVLRAKLPILAIPNRKLE
jgi:nucleotide-binding universal stress UspA family protein